jgi:hypothetical protein
MHMGMPGAGGQHGPHVPFRRHPMMLAFLMFQSLFWAAAAVCLLGAANRAANAAKLESRIKALKTMPDAFTEEERVELIHKVTTRALGPF